MTRNTKYIRIIIDKIAGNVMLILTLFSVFLAIFLGIGLYIKSIPVLNLHSIFSILTKSSWHPLRGEFGLYAFIMGTLSVTGISIIIALPVCLLSGIYLSEFAHPLIKRFVYPIIDILSGIPPVVYGVWGILAIVPFISNTIAPHFVDYSSGYSVLAGGIVLAVMITPLIISILFEIFNSVPKELKDASISLGATTWQTVKFVILRKSLPGIIAAVVLAISRSFGETIAVLMVCGNVQQVPHSVFEPCYPLPALIANNYGEMFSAPMYASVLMLAALILFLIILIFNTTSRIILVHIERRFAL